MQMQAGFMPGAMPGMGSQFPQRLQGPSPSDFSNNIRVQYTASPWQHTTPPPMGMGGVSAAPRPMHPYMTPQLPGASMGSGYNMARQSRIGSSTGFLSGMGSALGFGADLIGDTVAFGAGTAVGGLAGGFAASTAYNQLGIGNAISSAVQMPFELTVNRQRRAQQLQQSSTQFLNRGQQLSASGMGLSMGASMEMERGISSLANDNQFRLDTSSQFNRQDMMKMTQMAGNFGMLSDAQSTDEIKRSVVKISRAVHTFMKLAEEPDFTKAIESLARMRNVGFTMPEAELAVRNARTFSRMAGVSTGAMLDQAVSQGAPIAQRMGMTGAAGVGMHISAQGAAGAMAGGLGARQLELMGGREGLTSNIFSMNMQAANIDALLPAAVTMRDGKLTIDRDKLRRLMSGEVGLNQSIEQSTDNVGAMGQRGLQDLLSKDRGALRDQLTRMLGPQAGGMAMYTRARQLTQDHPQFNIAAAARILGADEQGARYIHEIGRNPAFFQGQREQLSQQERELSREDRARRRTTQDLARDEEGWFDDARTADHRRGIREHRLWAGSFGESFNRMMQSYGEDSDFAEQAEAEGGGDILAVTRGSKLTSELQRSALRDRVDAGSVGLRRSNLKKVREIRLENENILPFTGPEGFSFRQAGRGGEDLSSLLQLSLAEDLTKWGGRGFSTQEKTRRITAQQRVGATLAAATGMTELERTRGLERVGQEADLSEEKLNTIIRVGVNAYAKYLASLYHRWSRPEPVNEKDYKDKIRKALISEGKMDKDEAAKIVENNQVIEQIIAAAQAGLTEQERAVQDKSQETGEDLTAAQLTQDINVLERTADQQRVGVLSTALGVKSSETSEKDQRALIDTLSLQGPVGTINKEMLRIVAMSKGGTGGAGEAAVARRKLRARAKEFNISDAQMGDYMRQAEDRLGSIDSNVLARMGDNFAGSTAASHAAKMEQATRDLVPAFEMMQEIGLLRTLGPEGTDVLMSQGFDALRSQRNKISGLDAGLREQLGNEDFTQKDLMLRASRYAEVRTDAVIEGGSNTALRRKRTADLDDSETDAIEASLREDMIRSNSQFGESVGTFDEASRRLIKAADELTGIRIEDEVRRQLGDGYLRAQEEPK